MEAESSGMRFQRSPQADGTLAGDRAAIYHRGSRKAITLNPAGTILWQALDTPKSATELMEVLRQRFPQVPDETLQADVHSFVEQLQTQDLLQATD
jgi:hypothetical protein